MKNDLLESVKYWWVSLLVGALAIILGIWSIVTPDTTLAALSVFFIAAFLAVGIMEIIFAIANRNILSDWGWTLAAGILEVILGVMLLSFPLPVITLTLIYFVGFWIMFRSIWTIGISLELRRQKIEGWGWLLAIGILSVLFSLFFIFSPLFSGIFIIAFVSVALIVYGVFRIYLAFKIKSCYNKIKKIE